MGKLSLRKSATGGVGGGVLCGEKFVAVKNGIGASEKAKRLAFARNARAARSETDARARQGEAGDGN